MNVQSEKDNEKPHNGLLKQTLKCIGRGNV